LINFSTSEYGFNFSSAKNC